MSLLARNVRFPYPFVYLNSSETPTLWYTWSLKKYAPVGWSLHFQAVCHFKNKKLAFVKTSGRVTGDDQLLVNLFALFLVTVPEVFAKVNSA